MPACLPACPPYDSPQQQAHAQRTNKEELCASHFAIRGHEVVSLTANIAHRLNVFPPKTKTHFRLLPLFRLIASCTDSNNNDDDGDDSNTHAPTFSYLTILVTKLRGLRSSEMGIRTLRTQTLGNTFSICFSPNGPHGSSGPTKNHEIQRRLSLSTADK